MIARAQATPWWVKFLLAYVAAITIVGKGPTYLGVPPLYWGEMTLMLSLALIAPWVLRSDLLSRNRPLFVVIGLFMLEGAVWTALCFPRWHLNALRDAAIWYYALFFFVGLALTARARIADRCWWWMRVFWMISLVWNTADLLLNNRLSHSGPIIPWRGLPVLFNSTHEAGQNLALGAFIVLGTATLKRKPVWRALLAPVALLGLTVFAIAQGRGMRLGIASGMTVALVLALGRRGGPWLSRRMVTLTAVAVPVMLTVSLVYGDRFMSIAHLDRFEKADPTDPVGTANWRAVWWQHLYDAVMDQNPAFGLGFGQSLHIYHPLLWRLQETFIVRSPHNINVTIFARMGILGAGLWAAILVLGIGNVCRRAWTGTARGSPFTQDRRDEVTFWAVMLTATVVNSSFGVLMEGPVLGVWFWLALGFASGRSLSTGTTPASARLRALVRFKAAQRDLDRVRLAPAASSRI